MKFQLTTGAFRPNDIIPPEYTCEGNSRSPELTWENPPEGTGSFVLIVDDPDGGKKGFVHWILYNIPANWRKIPVQEAFSNIEETSSGVSDYKKEGYGPPCPPRGEHRYFFRLYAVEGTLPEVKGIKRFALMESMKGRILAETEVMGVVKAR